MLHQPWSIIKELTVIVKARGRGKSIARAVDVAQIIVKRMDNMGYKIGSVKIDSQTI